MSDKELLQAVLAELAELRKNQPKRINGAVGFMAEKLKLNIGTALAVAVPICSFIAMSTWTIAGLVASVKQDVKDIQANRWTDLHQQVFVERLASDNPTVKVPSVVDVKARVKLTVDNRP